MKIRVYKGQIVAVITQHGPGPEGHATSVVQNLELVPDELHPTEKWKYIGEQYVVKTNDVRRRESPNDTRYNKKHALTQDDINRLSAACGLNIMVKGGRDKSGRPPSVKDYNLAIHKRQYVGAPITPIAV